MDDCIPVIVNFSCLDDQVLVWNALKAGSRRSNVKITKDSRSNREKANYIKSRKVVARRRKSDFHLDCVPEADVKTQQSLAPQECLHQWDDFEDGERSLLLHGVPSDWVEEEMMEDDLDFIRDVLEQKVFKCLASAGIERKVTTLKESTGQPITFCFRLGLLTSSDGRKVPVTGMLSRSSSFLTIR